MAFNRTLQHFTSSQELATPWASGQSYILNQIVIQSNALYLCLIAHTSGLSFATDLAAGKWIALTGGSGSNVFAGGAVLTGTYNGSVLVLGDCTLSGASVTINGDFTVLGGIFTSGSPAVTIKGDVRVSNGFDYSTTTQQTLTIDGDYYLGQPNTTSRTTTTTVGSSTAGVGSSFSGSIFPSPSIGDLTLIITNVFNPYALKNVNLTNYNYYLTITFTSGALSGQSFSDNVEIIGTNEIYVGDSGIPVFAVGDSFTLTYTLYESYAFRGRSTQVGNNLTVNGSIYATSFDGSTRAHIICLCPDITTSSLSKANGGNLNVGGDVIINGSSSSSLFIFNSGSSVNGGNGGIVTIFGNVTGFCNFTNTGGQGTTSLAPGNGGKININGNFTGRMDHIIVSDQLYGEILTGGGGSISSLNATVAKGGAGGNVSIGGYCSINNINVSGSGSSLAGVFGGNAGIITFKGYVVLGNLFGLGGGAAPGTNRGAASTIYFGAGCGIKTLATYLAASGNPASGSSRIIFNGNCSIHSLTTEVGQPKQPKDVGTSGLYIPVVLRVNLFQNDGILTGTSASTASQIGISADRLYTYNNTLGRWQHTTSTNT